MDSFIGNFTAGYSVIHEAVFPGSDMATIVPYATGLVGGKKKSKSKSTKVVKGAKYQERPSASYYYNELKKPVGYKVSYRPRKGGKYILHSLRLRENGSPYWRPEEKLPKLSKKKTKKNKRTKRK